MVVELPDEETDEQPRHQPAGQSTESDGGGQETSAKEPRAEVSRILESGKRAYLCEIAPENVTERFFQQNFGGGNYFIRLWKRAPKGSGLLLVRGGEREIRIDPRIASRIPSWVMAESADGTPASVDDPKSTATRRRQRDVDDDDPEIRNMVRLQLVEMMKDSNDMRARAAESQTALLASVMKMMETSSNGTAALIGAFTKAKPEGGDTTKTALELLAALEKIRPAVAASPAAGADGLGAIDRALSLLLKFRDAGEGLDLPERGEPKDDLLTTVVKETLPAIASALSQRAAPATQAPAEARAGVTVVPQHAEIRAAAPPQPPETAAVPSWLLFAKQSLLEAAEEARDPSEVALSIMTLAPRKAHGQIREAVMREDAVAALVAFAPEFESYQGWLTECVQALREEFAPPEAGDPSPEPEKN